MTQHLLDIQKLVYDLPFFTLGSYTFNQTGWLSRKRDILWFVSNCKHDRTKRIEFARKLEKESALTLDIFGGCGKGRVSKEAEDQMWTEYKFYLAFENTACKDYITEKFFKVLGKEVIPVVRGAPYK